MSRPPLNLLLPHVYTFREVFTDYPVHISSSSPASLLTHLLLYHASQDSAWQPAAHRDLSNQDSEKKKKKKSLVLNCYGSKDLFQESLSDPGNALSAWFRGEGTTKGKFLESADEIDVIHVTSLHELRALLYLLLSRDPGPQDQVTRNASSSRKTRGSTPEEEGGEEERGEEERDDDLSVADSQESIVLEVPRILAISGMDQIHREAGELSVQGLSRTFASALDAAFSMHANLVIHDEMSVLEEVPVINHTSTLPQGIENRTTLATVYRRSIRHSWAVHRAGEKHGDWLALDGGRGYRVEWSQNEQGECMDSKIVRL